ncbi:DUF3592 domain-containing protein [Frigoriglobus tundricola]|uniref:DUF3592 domain-containing protein n=1 Tax=Frigoriglobus tundricola TaxID=2774151 RepID=A0A6M5YM64_9BACT|nr:DUF3592 domain-containing protein [Frigoriglobus tundricola]QJW94426.1 hypothetical protein FTUN_1946 [Frigoriglobus tundricola]
MDQETEIARAKWLLMGVLFFLVSGCFSYGEAVYLVSGHEATATVSKTFESPGRRGGTRLSVEYTFSEPNGTPREGTDTVPTAWSVPANGQVPVLYISGTDGSSRLAGNVNWVALGIFAFSLVWIAVFAARLFGATRDEPQRRPRRRRD